MTGVHVSHWNALRIITGILRPFLRLCCSLLAVRCWAIVFLLDGWQDPCACIGVQEHIPCGALVEQFLHSCSSGLAELRPQAHMASSPPQL